MRRPRVQTSMRGMMGAVAVIALALFRAEAAMLLLVLTLSGLAIGSLLAGPPSHRSRRWAIPCLVTLACLYLPFGWIAWTVPPYGSRSAWLISWPVCPGLIPGLFAED